MNTDTLRTDARVHIYFGHRFVAECDYHQLQTELNEAKQQRDFFSGAMVSARQERDQLRAELSELLKANQYAKANYELTIEVNQLRAEVDRLKDSLVKEHLPKQYESWEKVWDNMVQTSKQRDQLRAEVERLKADAKRFQQERNEAMDKLEPVAKQRDQWREDAERLSEVLNRWTCSGLCTDPLCVMTKDALAAHKRLVQEANK